jgi:L-lactate dehydrogenase
VIGEHGDSEVLTWSQATIAGMRLDEFCDIRGVSLSAECKRDIEGQVRGAAYQIIAGKGATYYGIGSAVARLVDVLLHDQRAILTVSCVQEAGGPFEGLSFALPHLVGGQGVLASIPLRLTRKEREALVASAGILRKTVDSLYLGKAQAWH